MSALPTSGAGNAPALQGVALAFLGYGLFSVCDVAIKAIGTRLPVFEVSFLLVALSLGWLPFVREADHPWRAIARMQRPWLVIFRSIAGTVTGIFSIIAFTSVPLAEAYAVVFIAPVVALVLAALVLNESVGIKRWISVGLGIGGVLVVMRPGFRELELGHLSAVAAAIFAATSLLTLRVIGASERPASIYMALVVTNMVIAFPLMLWQGFVVPDLREILLLVLCGFASGGGQVAIMKAARLIPANQVAPTQYSQLAWAVIFGAAFFYEFPDTWTFAGLALIAASGFFALERQRRTLAARIG